MGGTEFSAGDEFRLYAAASGPGHALRRLHRTGAGAEAAPGRFPDLYAGVPGRGADHAAEPCLLYTSTAAGLYTVRQRLYELEERLAALRFARISHSEIVNLRQVTALDLTLTGTIRITLSDGTVCWASRRYVKRIKEVLGL